jgi:Amt family ammonium transporter
VVEHYGAVIIGAVSGVIMVAASKWMKKLRVDDPLDSISVHFFCGIWWGDTPPPHLHFIS